MKPATAVLADLRAAKRSLDGRTTWWAKLLKAIGFEVTQHARNHLALGLVVCFIPIWLGVVHTVIPNNTIEFHSRVLGHAMRVDANELAMISAVINAVTLIIGFLQFASVRRSSDFDQRLVLAGHPRLSMLAAKFVALVLASVPAAVYAAVVMDLFWEPRQPALVGFSLFTSALTYGGLGMVLGLALSSELAGMFVIIMVSLIDVMVQNPIINPSTDLGPVRLLPTYGSMQSAAVAGFTDDGAIGHALLGLLWLLLFGLVSVTVFHWRTKDHAGHITSPATQTASVIVTSRADGTLAIESTAGPILLCSELPGCPASCERTVPQPRVRKARAVRITAPGAS
ncbi:hypothetical protein SAMN04488074_102168 [Lentzea albidocapillata subsp. violacea]|uniref:ABC-2 family transporter protein n=1 Tax=Lentzea albidocapillata subsp. violacea TaxID=128104 RepID=A0A1G8U4S1_9PSEU|nr:hypothetical protein [Lentzea albidocapillata]SDJ48095.1 hypothetical protein SAMN04488074_102168 [Lentzea albidocapillata subsp. violacea]